METDLKKMDVEELLVIVWDNGAGDGYRGIQTRDVAAELIRRAAPLLGLRPQVEVATAEGVTLAAQ